MSKIVTTQTDKNNYQFVSQYSNQSNYNYKEHLGEVNNQPSETIPEQTLTIQQILERHSRGLAITGNNYPIYNEEDPFPDIQNMDLAEREEFYIQAKEEYEILQSKKRTQDEEKQYNHLKSKYEKEKSTDTDLPTTQSI